MLLSKSDRMIVSDARRKTSGLSIMRLINSYFVRILDEHSIDLVQKCNMTTGLIPYRFEHDSRKEKYFLPFSVVICFGKR